MRSETAKKNASAKKWSQEELEVVRRLYPKHGASWDGWSSVLPNRSKKSIIGHACLLKISYEGKRKEIKKEIEKEPTLEQVNYYEPDPFEDVVIAYMSAGMPASVIDRRMGWFSGSARMILTNRWERESKSGVSQ